MIKELKRQGDVMFIPRRGALPTGELQKREDGAVAYGEVTGHSHRLADLESAEVLVSGDGAICVKVHDGGATFVHEEHGPITLDPGNYDIRIQREYSPEAIRNVVD